MSVKISKIFKGHMFLPREIYNITTITRLNFYSVKICVISHNIINLRNLRKLIIQSTKSQKISKNILELKSLTYIRITIPHYDTAHYDTTYSGPLGNMFYQYYRKKLSQYLFA